MLGSVAAAKGPFCCLPPALQNANPHMATGPGMARAGLGCDLEPGQEAAGDALGSSIDGLAAGDSGAVDSGAVDSGAVDSGAVVDRAGDELAPGLLHAVIAPTRAKASRILLNMRTTPRMCPGRGESGSTGDAGP